MDLIAQDNRKIVVGLGVTGLSCARHLYQRNESFAVVDSRDIPPGLAEFQQEFPDVPLMLGELDGAYLAAANELIVSPGVSLNEPAIQYAVENGVNVCGDIDLFCREVSVPIVAITGSNGKSTVTTLVGEMAKKSDINVAVGGNIGIPALELLKQKSVDLYVLELSSFQLERAGNLGVELATVLNISPDHMDRYPDILAYHRAKHRVFNGCKKIVINRSDPLSKPLLNEEVEVWTFGLSTPDFNGFGLIKSDDGKNEYLAYQFEKLMPIAELKMAGRHNIENALAALAIGWAMKFEMDSMLSVLREFKGLDHRCQFVDEIAAVRYYNDSKGTNVGAALASITGLSDDANKIVLIAGGDAKGADFKPLIPAIEKHARAVMLIGVASDLIEATMNQAGVSVPATKVKSMKAAVSQAQVCAQPGDAVLLSPACASFDMFENYQQRGAVFAQCVSELSSESLQSRGYQ